MFVSLTLSTKLRWFQYNIFYRTLSINIKVARWNDKVTSMCTFYSQESETISHLLYDCHIVNNFWLRVRRRIISEYSRRPNVAKEMVVFSNYRGPNNKMINVMSYLTIINVRTHKFPLRKLNARLTVLQFIVK